MKFKECKSCIKYDICGTGDESDELYCERHSQGYISIYDEDGETPERNPAYPKRDNLSFTLTF